MKRYIFITIVVTLLLYTAGCGKISTPTGGPRDSIPPVMTNANPKKNTVFFDKDEIVLTFDEYITLKDINKQLIISPPLGRDQYKIFPQTGASKKITVELLDSLLSNTTYTFNFGSAIADYNESNPLPFFSYSFSTGAVIDSLRIKGRIEDAYEKETQRFISVQLYPVDTSFTDSTIYLKKPFYVSSTLDTTLFELQNVKAGRYEIIALEDLSGNYIFDQNSDKIGFSTTQITLPQDSIINLRLFKEIPNFEWAKPYFINEHHIGLGYFGAYEGQTFEMVSPVPESFESLITKNPLIDTLNYWFKGAALDSLKFQYIVQDSIRTETVLFRNPTPDSLVIKQKTQGSLRLTENFHLTSNLPVVSVDTSFASVRNRDSVPIPFSMYVNKNYDEITFDFEVLPNDQYKIDLYPDALTDFFGNTNDSLSYTITTKKIEEFGNIYIRLVHNEEKPFILELINANSEVIGFYNTKNENGVYPFLLLPPGKYDLRFIADDNGNKKWDTGSYLKKIQPEVVTYYPEALELRANWDLNETFNPEKVKKEQYQKPEQAEKQTTEDTVN